MKKSILFIALSILLVAGVWKGYQRYQTPTSVLSEQALPRITLTLVEEDTIATSSNVFASTVFEALQTVTTEKHIPLKTKKYDFGIFVEEIGNKPNLKDHAWLYFVNGISGDIAADKKTLHTGDSVEWRYMKPIY